LWGGSRAIGAGERSEDRKLDMLRDTLGMQYAMTGLDFDYNRPKMDMRNVALGELYTGIGGKPGGLNITPSGDLDPRKVFAQFPASQMGTKARG